MPYIVRIDEARAQFPEYDFLSALTPSEQKAAFHVRDQQGRSLCLKIIGPNYNLDRLSREILALQAIDHPNVARLVEYTFTSKDGSQRHYMVEEFIEGADLSINLRSGTPWARDHAATFFAALCDGLHAIHESGVVHRDLKPSNIRVRPDGSPAIIDLGVARHLGLPDLTNTADGAAIGTPLYFSPEQFRGTKHDIDRRTDLFAIGVLFHQALVGHHPFFLPSMDRQALSDAVCQSRDFESSSSYKGLPSPWRLLISRLLEKERVRRPQTAEQVAVMLRKLEGF